MGTTVPPGGGAGALAASDNFPTSVQLNAWLFGYSVIVQVGVLESCP